MYASLITFCDQQLGRVLDAFDEHNLWEDTMLIVNTDHGLLMGEHDWWAKVVTPFFQEIAHIPFWAYDPRTPDKVDKKSDALAQTIDLGPTILDFFDIPLTEDMQGKPIFDYTSAEKEIRQASLYGVMGGQVNVTDGEYVYMRANTTEDNKPLFDYTLMPTHMKNRFKPRELQEWEKVEGFGFMKGCKVMQIPTRTFPIFYEKNNPLGRGRTATLLFDVNTDPGQINPLDDQEIEMRMIKLMIKEMARNECPSEQYVRLGLPEPERLGKGHGDDLIKMPSDKEILDSCVLKKPQGVESAEHGAEGFPKMPFKDIFWEGEKTLRSTTFPDNLRLRPGYLISQSDGPIKKE